MTITRAAIALALLGAGGLYGDNNLNDQEPTRMTEQVITKRDDLRQLTLWEVTTIRLVVPSSTGARAKIEQISAKAVHYKPTRTSPVGLVLFSDVNFHNIHIGHRGQNFYVLHNEDVIGVVVGAGQIGLNKSYFKAEAPATADSVVAAFMSKFNDEALIGSIRATAYVDLREGVRLDFFTSAPKGSTGPGIPTVTDIDVASGILKLDLLSPQKYVGTFWIDLNTRRLVRTVVDGTEVYKAG